MQRTFVNAAISTVGVLAWSDKSKIFSDKFETYRPPSLNMQTAVSDGSGELTKEICSRSVDRLLLHNVDFNEIIAANTGEWVDETFDFPESIYWDDMRPKSSADDESNNAQNMMRWERLSDRFPASDYSLWGTTGISAKDPTQGSLGDCWIMTASAAIATDPARIKKIFLT